MAIDKCKISITEVKYFEMYIRKDEIRINPENVKDILKQITLKSVKDLLSFLRF